MENNIEYQDPFEGEPIDPNDNDNPFDDEDDDFYDWWREQQEDMFERAMNNYFEN